MYFTAKSKTKFASSMKLDFELHTFPRNRCGRCAGHSGRYGNIRVFFHRCIAEIEIDARRLYSSKCDGPDYNKQITLCSGYGERYYGDSFSTDCFNYNNEPISNDIALKSF